MTARKIRLLVLAVVGLAQLAVPAAMILGRERTLAEGEVWRFRTAPVDPVDAFRGRYLALGFEQRSAPIPEGISLESGQRVYVPLYRDDEGFAELGPVGEGPPGTGSWLRLPIQYTSTGEDGTPRAWVQLPFDRLYLEEELAPKVDAIFLDRTRGEEGLPAWAVVRVLDGRAVLEDVVVDGTSVRDLVAE